MQFLTSLIGGAENTYLTAALALGVVLVLIVLGLWVLKVFFRASNNIVLGRSRRLMVVEQVAIDQKRRLLLIRRDNVEHVVLTGGAQELLIESGIPVERSVPARPSQPGVAATTPAPAPRHEERIGPSRPVTDALEAASHIGQHGHAPEGQKREGGPRPGHPSSLRHTGLLRPVSRMSPAAVIPMNPDAAEPRRLDSAKTGPTNTSGQAGFGGGTYRADGIKAEGN